MSRGRVVFVLFGACASAPDDEIPLELNEDPYGECLDDQGRAICRDDEPFCDGYPAEFPELTVCAADCGAASDCPAPAGGEAMPICAGEPAGCSLDCSGGAACPDGMECAPTGACMWRG
jgi:hypothetical protein